MRRLVTAYLIGVAVAITLLGIGLTTHQDATAAAGVVVALAVGLLSLLPQLLSANAIRYADHKEYFAGTLLPQAGGMQLISGDGVVFLPSSRIAWRLQDSIAPTLPGYGETPLFEGMLRPHLRTGGLESAWSDFAEAFFAAEERVKAYTHVRREYDGAFGGTLDKMIRERVGEGFRVNWWYDRAMDHRVTESRFATPTYNARNFRDTCELAYSGRFESDPGNHWENHLPVSASEDRQQELPWRIKVGGGDGRDYIWGGQAPEDLQLIATALRQSLEELRDNASLKAMYLRAEEAELAAKEALRPLASLADHAAVLLRHGPDIPGTCGYCKGWSPRL